MTFTIDNEGMARVTIHQCLLEQLPLTTFEISGRARLSYRATAIALGQMLEAGSVRSELQRVRAEPGQLPARIRRWELVPVHW